MSADCKTMSGTLEEGFPNANLDCLKTRRHPSHTFCILMGHTGAGKTSTFNHLLNTHLPVSNKSSATRSVDVYSAATPDLGNLNFIIVDTPGMNDTNGIHQDACNMHAVQKFRQDSVGVGVLPNIILLCVKATDNRIEGPESDFVRNIRTLESIKVIDDEKPNVVIVITHACALPPVKYKEKKEEITKNYKRIMNDTLCFSAPVVFIENAPADYLLKKDTQTAGTLLPDREIQPINLLNQVTDMLGKNGDGVAFKCMKKLQQLGSRINYSKRGSNQIKTASYNGKNLDEDEKLCLKLLAGNTEAFRIAAAQFEQERKQLQEEIDREREEMRKKEDEMTKKEMERRDMEFLEKERKLYEIIGKESERLKAEFLHKEQKLFEEAKKRESEIFQKEKKLDEMREEEQKKANWTNAILGGAATVSTSAVAFALCAIMLA